MIVIGLTGSIGMGKSITANVFRGLGVRVHDSDAAVHAIYRGAEALKVDMMFPGVLVDGAVDREALSNRVLNDQQAMKSLENLIHPLVVEDRDRFVQLARDCVDPLIVLDIPLLFEIGGVSAVDVVVVVTAPLAVQKARVLARPGMTVERFEAIVAKQLPDSLKRKAAHYVVDTSSGLRTAKQQVCRLLHALSSHQGSHIG